MSDDPRTETFYWDAETGEPCPRDGNVLCTLPYDADHRHTHTAPLPTEAGDVERDQEACELCGATASEAVLTTNMAGQRVCRLFGPCRDRQQRHHIEAARCNQTLCEEVHITSMTISVSPDRDALFADILAALDADQNDPDADHYTATDAAVRAVIAAGWTSPAEMERVKAEARRTALVEAANDPSLRLSGHSGISIKRLRARAEGSA